MVPRVREIAASRGTLFVLAAAVLWGTTGTAQALAPPGASPLAVGALRLAIGGGALVVAARLRGTLHMAQWRTPSALVAAAAVAAYQVSFFAGVSKTGVAVGTLVAIGSAPVITGLLDMLVSGGRPTPRWWAATGGAIIGCGLLLGGHGTWQTDAVGVLLALTAGVAFAVYTVASKKLLRSVAPDAVMATTFFVGALLLSPLLLAADLRWVADVRGLLVVLHLGLVATAIAYVFYGRGLTKVPAATAATLTIAEPLTAGLLGVAILGEQLSPLAYAGTGLIFAALALLSSERPSTATGARSTATGARRLTRPASYTHGKNTRRRPPTAR